VNAHQASRGKRQAVQATAAVVVFSTLAAVAIVSRLYTAPTPTQSSASPHNMVGAMQDPSGAPVATPSIAASPVKADPSACQTIISELSGPPPSVRAWSAMSDEVVSGTVVAVNSGRWATADGSRPTQIDISAADVYRVVTIQIGGVGKASVATAARAPVGRQVQVRVLGGKIGCSTYQIAGQADVAVGQNGIWFLTAKTQPPLKSAPVADFDVIDNWPISNGSVVLPDGSEMSPASVLTASQAK
jgi:hypothetical protein